MSNIKCITILLTLVITSSNFAIGNFQVGFGLGVTPNLNNLSSSPNTEAGQTSTGQSILPIGSRRDNIEFYDNLIESAKATGATGSTVGNPLALTFGIDFRYIWNSLFMRLGFDYSTLVSGTKGSLKTTNFNDSIEYASYNISMPISFGFSYMLNDFQHFYMGVGPYYGYSQIEVTHSAPSAFTETALATATNVADYTPYKKQSIAGDLWGFHLLMGVQVPLVEKRVYVSFDYMYIQARSLALNVTATDASDTTVSGKTDTIFFYQHRFMFGIQYLISM